jgi:hypothetical protein
MKSVATVLFYQLLAVLATCFTTLQATLAHDQNAVQLLSAQGSMLYSSWAEDEEAGDEDDEDDMDWDDEDEDEDDMDWDDEDEEEDEDETEF